MTERHKLKEKGSSEYWWTFHSYFW